MEKRANFLVNFPIFATHVDYHYSKPLHQSNKDHEWTDERRMRQQPLKYRKTKGESLSAPPLSLSLSVARKLKRYIEVLQRDGSITMSLVLFRDQVQAPSFSRYSSFNLSARPPLRPLGLGSDPDQPLIQIRAKD